MTRLASTIPLLPRHRLIPLLRRVDRLLERLEPPAPPNALALDGHWAFRWERAADDDGRLVPIPHPRALRPEDLLGIDHARATLLANTRQFLAGHPANDALLWGSRGTGKSSLVKAVAHALAPEGLKLVEIHKEDLFHLPLLLSWLEDWPHRFVLFCDDLSFSEEEVSYKALKALLEGSIHGRPDNVLLYVTSNRRHLITRHFTPEGGEEIHPGESTEEQVSLSDRFGLWLGFHPFDQETYLAIVSHHAQGLNLKIESETLRRAALDWARTRGARSGRVAWQFVRDLAGRLAMGRPPTP